mmetsp:Transcript_21521/g.53022  ORF Transcript_21521/g.53022 Transcript_21521/m.53022 type:complete len:238 (+) Transcript_21521:66-779(+)
MTLGGASGFLLGSGLTSRASCVIFSARTSVHQPNSSENRTVTRNRMSPIHPSSRSGFIRPTVTRPNTVISLIKMFIEGPDVSLKGSPTVSPATVALCHSDPLPLWGPNCPASVIFLALSHAPPALDIRIPIMYPDPMAATRRPTMARIPKPNPMINGDMIAMSPGMIISMMADRVEIATHLVCSGRTPVRPSRRPGMSRNCLRTSTIIAWAARDTANMVRAPNKKGSMMPINTDATT